MASLINSRSFSQNSNHEHFSTDYCVTVSLIPSWVYQMQLPKENVYLTFPSALRHLNAEY